ncbi:MAG: biopolymer transporter ExbD [Opitutaceae bacterium]
MVTRPLDLLSRLRRVPSSGDWLYFVNVGLIGLFFVLFYSKHVIAPGIILQSASGKRGMVLPSLSQTEIVGGQVDTVVRVMSKNLVYTWDGKYTFAEFQAWLRQRAGSAKDKRMLVMADDSVSLNDFTAIFDAANEAGFSVQFAAEPSVPHP